MTAYTVVKIIIIKRFYKSDRSQFFFPFSFSIIDYNGVIWFLRALSLWMTQNVPSFSCLVFFFWLLLLVGCFVLFYFKSVYLDPLLVTWMELCQFTLTVLTHIWLWIKLKHFSTHISVPACCQRLVSLWQGQMNENLFLNQV